MRATECHWPTLDYCRWQFIIDCLYVQVSGDSLCFISLRNLAHAINRFLSFKIENFSSEKFSYFSYVAQSIYFGYTLELPHRGGSNGYTQSMFWSKN